VTAFAYIHHSFIIHSFPETTPSDFAQIRLLVLLEKHKKNIIQLNSR